MAKLRIYCNSCRSKTWHEVVASHAVSREDDFWGDHRRLEAEILECSGCNLLSFRSVKHSFEFQDKDDQPEEELFPERGYKKRKRRFFFELPKPIRTLYEETLEAHDRGLKLLSTVGLRALVEAIVVDKLDEQEYGPNLESKINALAPHFSSETVDALHEFRMMGNRAIHAQVAPEALDVHRALYVAEGIMEYYYGIDDHAAAFQRLRERKGEAHDGQ